MLIPWTTCNLKTLNAEHETPNPFLSPSTGNLNLTVFLEPYSILSTIIVKCSRLNASMNTIESSRWKACTFCLKNKKPTNKQNKTKIFNRVRILWHFPVCTQSRVICFQRPSPGINHKAMVKLSTANHLSTSLQVKQTVSCL